MIELELAINLVTIALVAWAAITQVVIPLTRGTRLFPAFSKHSHAIADEIAEVDQEIEAEHLTRELAHKRAQLTKEQHDQ